MVYHSLVKVRDLYWAAQSNLEPSISADVLKGAPCKACWRENRKSRKNKQYIAIDDKEMMRPITRVGQEGAIILLACRIGSVRLIDIKYIVRKKC